MALSTKAKNIIKWATDPKQRDIASPGFRTDFIEQTAAKLASKRVIPSPGPGEKLIIDKHGNLVLEKIEPERFRKGGGLSPKTIEFVKSLIGTSPVDRLLKEVRSTAMNNREQRQVLEAVLPEMARSIRSRPHVMQVGKRAGMEPLSGLAPAWTRPKPTTGLSTSPELEQQITTEVLNPEEAARQFVARRIPRQGIPGAGMKPRTDTDAYGVPVR
jgi:hypothetical protein